MPEVALTVRQRVLDALRGVAPGLSEAALNPATALRDQVDLDSMDWMNLLVVLRDTFGVDVPEADYAKLVTLDDIVGYLGRGRPACSGRSAPMTGSHRLADGRTVTIRPIRADDADRVRHFLAASSPASRYMRFQEWIQAPSNTLVHFLTGVDDRHMMALVATVGTETEEEIVAEARCAESSDGKSCELGLLVEDSWQKTGVAGLLLEALIEALRARGFETMEGLVLASNAPMLHFAHGFGFEIEPMKGDLTTLRIRKGLQSSPAAAAAAALVAP